MAPLSGATQARPQQSSLLAHGSPAGRQPGMDAHIPAMQVPLQQSCATVHGLPVGAQLAPPQTPPLHASAQHAPAAAQVWPSEEQPAGLAQTVPSQPLSCQGTRIAQCADRHVAGCSVGSG